jgi:polar amino acid transport system substrate-binding protein
MLPAVVLLMILFYIVFARASVSGIFVSVVAFSMTFAAAVFGMLKSSINAIDRGQTEAAYALGFSNLRTFFKIVLPQAMVYFLPAYKSELISLIKATAIVGYIAVQDLTRVGDIVRSRTYEAFFPLISIALIYFALAGLLITIAGRLEFRFDPKRRKKEDILKGIKTDD